MWLKDFPIKISVTHISEALNILITTLFIQLCSKFYAKISQIHISRFISVRNSHQKIEMPPCSRLEKIGMSLPKYVSAYEMADSER